MPTEDEPTWRSESDVSYQWAVERDKLRYRINGREFDVADEYGIDLGNPELVREAIAVCNRDSFKDVELAAKLVADLDALLEGTGA